MDFFRLSAGQWNSQRTTHHLPFRRAELGGSIIAVEALEAEDPSVVEICQLHSVDPALAVGGALVTWQGSMAWDKDDENHEGRTVFSLVPDADNPGRANCCANGAMPKLCPSSVATKSMTREGCCSPPSMKP
jgi:hypothetical protein